MLIALHTSALSLDAAGTAGAPDWLQLIPAGTFSGVDGRGPYTNDRPADIVARFASEGRKLPIDENHSIDLLGPKGASTPARGWIDQLEVRDGSVWGKAQWTDDGKALVAGHAYGFLSPVFNHSEKKPYKVGQLLRVSLTNDPNLTHLKSLHSREDTAMLELLRKALGLPETATETEVTAAVTAMHAANQANVALMAKIAEAAGAPKETTGDALVTALQSAVAKPAATGEAAEIATLKGQVTALHNQLTGYVSVTSKDRATAVVEKAIEAGKLIPALKDHYIARHMKEAADVEKEIALLPSLHAGGLGGKQPTVTGDAGAEPDATEKQIAAMMGVDPTAYAATRKTLYGAGA